MPQLACQWTDWDATYVVTSYHVLDMSAMLRLPGQQRPLPSNSALNICSYERLEAERLNKFC